MKAELEITTHKRNEIIDITKNVGCLAKKSKTKEGLCIIYCPHTTAAITINENAGVENDLLKALGKLIQEHCGYEHDKIDNNAAAHIKSSLMGNSKVVPVESGELQLGEWQHIFFCEFDGPRKRKIHIKIIGD